VDFNEDLAETEGRKFDLVEDEGLALFHEDRGG